MKNYKYILQKRIIIMQLVENQIDYFFQKQRINLDGKTLKELRVKKGLSQQQLADLTGVPLGTIGRLETSNDEIKKVSTNRTFEEFFKNEEKRGNNPTPFESNAIYIGPVPGPGEETEMTPRKRWL